MNGQRWMSRHYFSFFITWGIFLPYWTGWMIHTKGISVSQASLIMSLGLVARGLSTLVVFPYLTGKTSSKRLLNGTALLSLLVLICFLPANSFISLLVMTMLLHLCYPTLMPALDSAAGVLMQSNQLKHYGKSRLWGSIAFVIGGLIVSFFTGAFGDRVILWSLIMGTLVIVSLGTMKAPDVLSMKPQTNQSNKRRLFHLFRAKHFGLVLLIVILLQSAHASYYSYGYIFLQSIHAPTYLIGLIINLAVLAEIFFFSIADKTFGRFSSATLLTFAAMGSTLRWLLVFTFPNVVVFCLAQPLHACSFAMVHFAFMKYLTRTIPNEQISQAQGMYSAFALSWGTAILTVFGGYLYAIEPRYAFIGMIVCTLPAMLLALIFKKLEHEKTTATI